MSPKLSQRLRQSSHYTKTIELAVDLPSMNKRRRLRLGQLLHRDDGVIRRVLGIIQQHGSELIRISRRGRQNIDSSKLHELIYTTRNREEVVYDLKREFRIDSNSLIECRRTAESLYNSFLALRQLDNWMYQQFSYPKGLMARSINHRRFELYDNGDIGLLDSIEGKISGRYPRLRVAVRWYDYARKVLQEGKPQEMQVVAHRQNSGSWKYVIHLRIRKELHDIIKQEGYDDKEIAVVGVDLGIDKAMVCSVLTRQGVVESRVIDDKRMERRWKRIQQLQIDLQAELNRRVYHNSLRHKIRPLLGRIVQLAPRDRASEFGELQQQGIALVRQVYDNDYREHIETKLGLLVQQVQEIVDRNMDRAKLSPPLIRLLQRLQHICGRLARDGVYQKIQGVHNKLDRVRDKVYNIKTTMDRQLVKELKEYLQQWIQDYRVYLFVGDLRGIAYKKIAGNSRGVKNLRRAMVTWSYRRQMRYIEECVNQLGLVRTYGVVYEYYTSSHCHRCRKRGVRPRQHTFYCSYQYCGWRGNADINGSINIAKQGIYYKKLRQEFTNSSIEDWLAPPYSK